MAIKTLGCKGLLIIKETEDNKRIGFKDTEDYDWHCIKIFEDSKGEIHERVPQARSTKETISMRLVIYQFQQWNYETKLPI